MEIADFCGSALGQVVYSKNTPIEPLIEHIKSTFSRPSPVRGYESKRCHTAVRIALSEIAYYTTARCKRTIQGNQVCDRLLMRLQIVMVRFVVKMNYDPASS